MEILFFNTELKFLKYFCNKTQISNSNNYLGIKNSNTIEFRVVI